MTLKRRLATVRPRVLLKRKLARDDALSLHLRVELPATPCTARRVARLRASDAAVSCFAARAGSAVRVRAGPFALRRTPEGDVLVAPGLLWAFACLAADDGAEPEVTARETARARAFLGRERAHARRRGDARAVALLAGARATLGAIARASAPLSAAHRRALVSRERVLSVAACARVVAAAEKHAAAGAGWASRRHANYPTPDLAVGDVPAIASWLPARVVARLLPELAARFALPAHQRLFVSDLFVAKYAARAGARPGLEAHEDASPWSFVVPLNGGREFAGGGTQFVELEGAPTLRPAPGYALMFAGRNRHRGVPVTAGVRYVLAGFLGLEAAAPPSVSSGGGVAAAPASQPASAAPAAVTPLQDLSALYGAAELGGQSRIGEG